MLFLPYKMDTRKQGIPLFTVIICIVCCLVYWEQYEADVNYWDSANSFCQYHLDASTEDLIKRVDPEYSYYTCHQFFESIRNAENPRQRLDELAESAPPLGLFADERDDFNYLHSALLSAYRSFERVVPRNLTNDLAYDPNDMSLWKMVTSTFSHGDVFHLLGNLLFFYIFAASVELIIGNVMFALFIGSATVGTSVAYSYVMAGVEGALPTVGLSGVVMAALAALGLMMPSASIRCFFWFFLYFRTFCVPVLFLAIWYVGWDIYDMNEYGNESYINYTAHISGALIGACLAIYYRVFKFGVLREAGRHY